MNAQALTRAEVRRVDQLAVSDYGMSGLVLMENAGRGCVDVLCQLGIGGPVAICCYRGNNGGDGLVIARHLDLRGFDVRVLLFAPADDFVESAAANLAILQRSDIALEMIGEAGEADRWRSQLNDADWVVDALLGTGATGNPRAPLDGVIRQLNETPAKKLAVDVPSGLDCDTATAGEPTFRADHTCTFVAAKPGLLQPSAAEYVGQLHVLDIGAPRKLVESVVRSADPT